MADVLIANDNLNRALQAALLNKKIKHEVSAADPANGMVKTDLAWGDLQMAEILLRQGKATQSAPIVHEALAIFEQGNPGNKYWHAVELGSAYLDIGKVEAALAERAGSPADKKKHCADADFVLPKSSRRPRQWTRPTEF